MEGSARKVITVRSALMVKNRLDVPMEVRLDSPSAPDSESLSALSVRFYKSINQRFFMFDLTIFINFMHCVHFTLLN